MSKWKPCYMIKDEPVTIPMDLLIEPEKAKEVLEAVKAERPASFCAQRNEG